MSVNPTLNGNTCMNVKMYSTLIICSSVFRISEIKISFLQFFFGPRINCRLRWQLLLEKKKHFIEIWDCFAGTCTSRIMKGSSLHWAIYSLVFPLFWCLLTTSLIFQESGTFSLPFWKLYVLLLFSLHLFIEVFAKWFQSWSWNLVSS